MVGEWEKREEGWWSRVRKMRSDKEKMVWGVRKSVLDMQRCIRGM